MEAMGWENGIWSRDKNENVRWSHLMKRFLFSESINNDLISSFFSLIIWRTTLVFLFLFLFFFFFCFFFFFFFLSFLGLHPRHMDVPRLGVESEQ